MVNIIIPTYNARDTLPRALNSLVAQTKNLFIVTIVQDCDEEDYSDIVAEYERRGLNIRLLKNKENMGPGLSRQAGMDSDLQSEYFMFMDADDMLLPRAVEVLTKEAKANDVDMGLSDFYADRAHQPGYLMKCTETPVTWCHGKIYRAQYLRDNNIRFLPQFRLNEDSYFNLVACSCTEKKFYLNETTYLWMDNPNSLTREVGNKDFFRRSWTQYVGGQVLAINKIVDCIGKISIGSLALTLINIYDHCMRALYLGFDINVPELDLLHDQVVIGKAIGEQEFWNVIQKELKGSAMFENDLIFYRMRFCDWLNQYVLKTPDQKVIANIESKPTEVEAEHTEAESEEEK